MPSTFLNNPGYSHVRVALTPFFLSEVTLSFLGYKGNIPSASVPCWNQSELGSHTPGNSRERRGVETKGSDRLENRISQCLIWIIWEHFSCSPRVIQDESIFKNT